MLLAIGFVFAILWTVTGYAKSGDSRFEDATEKKSAGLRPSILIVATIRGAGNRARLQPAFILGATVIAQAIIRCAKQAWVQCLQLYEPESRQQQMQQQPERLW